MKNGLRTVSIIIPTYNRAKILGITLESCINQTYPKDLCEIIIADNNSSDNTKQVVEEWMLWRHRRTPQKRLQGGANYPRKLP